MIRKQWIVTATLPLAGFLGCAAPSRADLNRQQEDRCLVEVRALWTRQVEVNGLRKPCSLQFIDDRLDCTDCFPIQVCDALDELYKDCLAGKPGTGFWNVDVHTNDCDANSEIRKNDKDCSHVDVQCSADGVYCCWFDTGFFCQNQHQRCNAIKQSNCRPTDCQVLKFLLRTGQKTIGRHEVTACN